MEGQRPEGRAQGGLLGGQQAQDLSNEAMVKRRSKIIASLEGRLDTVKNTAAGGCT